MYYTVRQSVSRKGVNRIIAAEYERIEDALDRPADQYGAVVDASGVLVGGEFVTGCRVAAHRPDGAVYLNADLEFRQALQAQTRPPNEPVPVGGVSVKFADLAGCWVDIGEVVGRTERRVHLSYLRNLATGEEWCDVDLLTRIPVRPGVWFAGSRFVEGRRGAYRQRVPAFTKDSDTPHDRVGAVQPAGDSPQWLRHVARRQAFLSRREAFLSRMGRDNPK